MVERLRYLVCLCHEVKKHERAGRLELSAAHGCLAEANGRIAALRRKLDGQRIASVLPADQIPVASAAPPPEVIPYAPAARPGRAAPQCPGNHTRSAQHPVAAGVRRRRAGDRPHHLAGRLRSVREQALRGRAPGRRQRPSPGRRLGRDPLHALPAGRSRPHPSRLPAHAPQPVVLRLSRPDNGQGRPSLGRRPGLLRAVRRVGVAAARPGARLRVRGRRGADGLAPAGRRPPAEPRPLLGNRGPGHVPRLPRPGVHSRRTRFPEDEGPFSRGASAWRSSGPATRRWPPACCWSWARS